MNNSQWKEIRFKFPQTQDFFIPEITSSVMSPLLVTHSKHRINAITKVMRLKFWAWTNNDIRQFSVYVITYPCHKLNFGLDILCYINKVGSGGQLSYMEWSQVILSSCLPQAACPDRSSLGIRSHRRGWDTRRQPLAPAWGQRHIGRLATVLKLR